MKIRPIFIVNSIIATVFGLGFMFIPDFLWSLLGFSTEADGPLAMRFFGIMVLGVGVLTFSARNAPDSISRKAIVLFLFTIYTLIPIFHFWTILDSVKATSCFGLSLSSMEYLLSFTA